ncbi:hypothetical protein [Piscirickettsia salmonis]|uniref:hypothetical protein n=2 Tax=Piscirickettsia salmonis TaxID=1238 RepID=UPI0012BAD4F3|nr:hypothetical protein [Piscirickettsia salmonis]
MSSDAKGHTKVTLVAFESLIIRRWQMKISFKGELIDFRKFHSISTSETSIIFHGQDVDKQITLIDKSADAVDDICSDIVFKYCQGVKLVYLK